MLALAAVLAALNASVKAPGRSAAAHLGEHPDGATFTSLPRSGQINAAQMLAEWGDCREAYDGPDAVAALAGCTRHPASGKHRGVSFRWACNKRFRAAVTTFAGNSRHASPWAAQIYAGAIASGKDHPHAVRILARAWIRVLYRCWLDEVPYDPALHGAARRLALPHEQPECPRHVTMPVTTRPPPAPPAAPRSLRAGAAATAPTPAARPPGAAARHRTPNRPAAATPAPPPGQHLPVHRLRHPLPQPAMVPRLHPALPPPRPRRLLRMRRTAHH